MTRFPCSSCGRHSCTGECFIEDRSPPDDDYISPPVSEHDLEAYREWCREVDEIALQLKVARDLGFTIELLRQRNVA